MKFINKNVMEHLLGIEQILEFIQILLFKVVGQNFSSTFPDILKRDQRNCQQEELKKESNIMKDML